MQIWSSIPKKRNLDKIRCHLMQCVLQNMYRAPRPGVECDVTVKNKYANYNYLYRIENAWILIALIYGLDNRYQIILIDEIIYINIFFARAHEKIQNGVADFFSPREKEKKNAGARGRGWYFTPDTTLHDNGQQRVAESPGTSQSTFSLGLSVLRHHTLWSWFRGDKWNI